MSGIFRNLSNSGIARFRNVSNSGRGIFYGPGSPINPGTTTTTTTSTTTTTTTSGETTTTTTTTTLAPPVTFTLSYSNIDGVTACSNYPTIDTTVYYASPGSTLTNSTAIYTDYNLIATASNGFYSNGVNHWTVAANSGILNSQTSCTPTTTTTTTTTSTTTTTTTSNQIRIDWNLSEEGSGAVRLVIRNSSNIAILDEESVGVTPVGGTIYLNESDTPYSATVSVAVGAEVAQYRICNNTDSTEIVLNTNVPVSSTYTVSPTPTWSTIYATYGNTNTPINCPV